MSRFLDHTRSGKSDHTLRLGNVDVANRCIRSSHSSGSWMSEDGNVGKLRLGMKSERSAGFSHLH